MAKTLDDRALDRTAASPNPVALAGCPNGDLSWPLERAARLYGEKTALVDGERSVTYAQLSRRVGGLGAALDQLGVAGGGRVGVLAPNSLAHAEWWLGVPAFGRVLSHFDTLRAAASEEGGAIVKTMGDAVMAVFTDPAAAFRAMRKAQAALAAPDKTRSPLALKCSIHQGPCLAIGQNDRLDYFGTTVNVGSRLCALSTGADIVVSGPVMEDAGVAALVADPAQGLAASPEAAPLRGIGESAFGFWRVADSAF